MSDIGEMLDQLCERIQALKEENAELKAELKSIEADREQWRDCGEGGQSRVEQLEAKLSVYEEALKRCIGWMEPVMEGFNIPKDNGAYIGVLLFAKQALSSGANGEAK